MGMLNPEENRMVFDSFKAGRLDVSEFGREGYLLIEGEPRFLTEAELELEILRNPSHPQDTNKQCWPVQQ